MHAMPAVALTDLNSLAGVVAFNQACRKAGIQPLLGAEIDDPHTGHRVVLLARSMAGYSSISQLITSRQLNPEFQLDLALQTMYIDAAVLTDSPALLRVLSPIYPLCYAMITLNRGALEVRARQLLREYAGPKVAAAQVRFSDPEAFAVYSLARAIDQNTVVSRLTPADLAGITPDNHFASPQFMADRYGQYPALLAAAHTLAAACAWSFETGIWHFPTYPCADSNAMLEQLAGQGLVERLGHAGPAYHTRLRYELDMIQTLGFTDYFLVVWDIARFAREQQIPSIGRGSGANSLVAFALQLTHVDPIIHDLYFERFLNPQRQSPPDMDLDFCWKRRSRVIDYVFQRYGQAHVAMISTTVTLGLRSAFREVGKALGMTDAELSKLTKRFPYYIKSADSVAALKEAYPACRDLPLEQEPWQSIFVLSRALCDHPRHLSVHPGGIIITDLPISTYTPQVRSANGVVVTQVDMYAMEDLGLVKIDLLGNRSLAVYRDSLDMIRDQGLPVPALADLEMVYHDPGVRTMIRSGQTMGCFYIESPAMRSLLQKLGTDTFESLTAASSVIRPGVAESGMMDAYIARVRDPALAQYLHPDLEPLLKDTYGVMIYQEDVLKITHHLAGMSLADADLFRRAMSGKARSREAMQDLMDRFIHGCEAQGVPCETAREIARQIESFAGYSFCKAHSASYAQLSFQVTYLKCWYPAIFFCAVINNGGGFYSAPAYLAEARRMGVAVKLPSVNHSQVQYVPEEGAIRMGLMAIAEIPHHVKVNIVAERESQGAFTSLSTFVGRTQVSRTIAEQLIACGALDCFGLTRPQLMYDLLRRYDAMRTSSAMPLWTLSECVPVFPALTDITGSEQVSAEIQSFGFLVSWHPLALCSDSEAYVTADQLMQYAGQTVRMRGWCITAKLIRTRKKGRYMKFMSMEDLTGLYEATLFPDLYDQYASLTMSHGPYVLDGVVDVHFGVPALTIQRVATLTMDRAG